MKFLAPIFLLVICILASCGTSDNATDGDSKSKTKGSDNKVDTRIVSGEYKLDLYSFDKKDTLGSNISYTYYKDIDSTYKDSVNTIIKSFVRRNTVYEESIGSNSVMSHEFMQAHLDSFATIYYGEIDDEYDMNVWSLDMGIQVNEFYKEFVEVNLGAWSYAGGAHGNGNANIYNVDIATGKTLLLSDFFKDIPALTSIAEQVFRQKQKVAPQEDLAEAGYWFEDNKFHLNENFVFRGGMITFMYNAYEIAPYVNGPIDIELRIKDISPLLKRSLD